MPTKYRKRNHPLVVGVGLFCLSLSAIGAEYRCGWIENPGPGTWWITDKDAQWEISTPGGYSVSPQSIDYLPNVIPNEYIRLNGIYGYSCGCLSVDTDKQHKHIVKIHAKGKQVLLKQCLEDRAIANRYKEAAPTQSTQPVSVPGVTSRAPLQPVAIPPVQQSVQQRVQRMPEPAVSASKGYYVQVITTSDAKKANSLKKSFAQDGFETIVTSVSNNGKTLYRVNFGPFANKELAAQGQATLKGIFAGNANVQESILVSVKPTVPSIPSTSTRCFSKREGQTVTAIQMSIHRDRVSGYYAWEPHEKDGARGYFRGTLKGNDIIARHTYMVEGYIGTEEVAYRLVKGGLIQGSGEQVESGPDTSRFKNPAAIDWSDPVRYQNTNCRTIRGPINNALTVQKAILKIKNP